MSENSSSKKTAGQRRAEMLEQIIAAKEVEFFLDERGAAYAYAPCGDHCEVISLKAGFGGWIRQQFYLQGRHVVSDRELKELLNGLDAAARYGGQKKVVRLHNRVAAHGDAIYVDLSDERWRAVKITKDGWSIESDYPVRFKRHIHQAPQVEPVEAKPGAFKQLWRCFPNMANEDYRILLEVFTVTAAIPGFPHPGLEILGTQGSGKSTLEKALRMLVDPSITQVTALPINLEEMVLQLYQNYMPVFDNVSKIPRWVSDALCRAITGDASTRRSLYSDEGALIHAYQRVVMLNGITIQLNRGDLQDRAILLHLEAMQDKDRKTEEQLWKEFEEMRPRLVGALYSTISRAMELYPSIKIEEPPRMADFAQWGEAVARALGYPEGRFLDAYRRNRAQASGIVLAQSPVAVSVLILMEGRERWQGTPTELLNELEGICTKHGLDMAEFPRSASHMSGQLNRLIPNLAAEGLRVESRRSGDRQIIITRVGRPDGVSLSPRKKEIEEEKGESSRKMPSTPSKDSVEESQP